VVDGRPQARLHSSEGRSPSLDLVQFVGSGLLVHRVDVENGSMKTLYSGKSRKNGFGRCYLEVSNSDLWFRMLFQGGWQISRLRCHVIFNEIIQISAHGHQ